MFSQPVLFPTPFSNAIQVTPLSSSASLYLNGLVDLVDLDPETPWSLLATFDWAMWKSRKKPGSLPQQGRAGLGSILA